MKVIYLERYHEILLEALSFMEQNKMFYDKNEVYGAIERMEALKLKPLPKV